MDKFNSIHKLLKQKKYAKVIALMLDNKKTRIKHAFATDASDRNHSWYIIGDIYFKKSQFQKALHAFRQAVRAWMHDTEALLAIGNCYSEMGRPVLAERYYKKALLLADSKLKPIITYNLGNALYDQEKYSEAVLQYKKIGKSAGKVYRIAQRNNKKATAKIGC